MVIAFSVTEEGVLHASRGKTLGCSYESCTAQDIPNHP